MEVMILSAPKFEPIGVLDRYESLIWTERYYEAGDFQIYAPVDMEILEMCKLGSYLSLKGSDVVMVVETIEITTDLDTGNHMKITGRSLESLLDRRIVWGYREFTDANPYTVITDLLRASVCTSTTPANRRIPNFNLDTSYPSGMSNMSAQYFGDNIYDLIVNICTEKEIGFKVYIANYSSDGQGQMRFKLYSGTDRSYSQNTNPPIVFSPKYENLLSSNYLETDTIHKTAVLVGGDGEGNDRRFAEYTTGKTGLDRRETFVDASNISKTDENGEDLTDAAITEQLVQKGKEALAELDEEVVFEGEIEMTNQFVYGQDFFMGDIVQIVNEYGKEAKARVVELVRSIDVDGTHTIPTFSAIT